MIIRKPYAFLIKNFKKIHILLLALCAFIFFKNIQLRTFVTNFLTLGSYNSNYESIRDYVNIFVYLSLFVAIAIFILVMFLLQKKKKPWKLYLVPIIGYTVMLIMMISTRNFFIGYQTDTSTTTIRAVSDILFIVSIMQYVVFAILFIRITGMDLNKFNFQTDTEFLELTSADREQIEINIDIDKESINRGFKRIKRNLGYFYEEHKKICNTIIVLLSLILIFNIYNYIFITNKVYKQGQTLYASNYGITINNAYYSTKDKIGNIIDKGKGFVIIDLSVTNYSSRREINFNRFHLTNGSNSSEYEGSIYNSYFMDLGKPYVKTTIGKQKTLNTLLIFPVKKDLELKKYVLYYQEIHSQYNTHLRKIKINVTNLSKIEDKETKKLNENLTMETIFNKKRDITFENYEIVDDINYNYQICSTNLCSVSQNSFSSGKNNKILNLSFSSSYFDNKELIDFSNNYGKIRYIDKNGKTHTIKQEQYLTRDYLGNFLYLKVPNEVVDSEKISMIYVLRNKKYVYEIR